MRNSRGWGVKSLVCGLYAFFLCLYAGIGWMIFLAGGFIGLGILTMVANGKKIVSYVTLSGLVLVLLVYAIVLYEFLFVKGYFQILDVSSGFLLFGLTFHLPILFFTGYSLRLFLRIRK